MSGGRFNYDQYKIGYIADKIQEEIDNNDVKPEGWEEDWCGEWTGQLHSNGMIEVFKDAIKALRIAEVYAQRVDWYLSGDNSEESFIKRLRADLADIIVNEKDV